MDVKQWDALGLNYKFDLKQWVAWFDYGMCFFPIESIDQKDPQSAHRLRAHPICQHTGISITHKHDGEGRRLIVAFGFRHGSLSR